MPQETLKELNKRAIEDPELVSSVADRLNNLGKLTSEVDDDQADDEPSPTPPTPEPDNAQADDEGEKGTPTPEPDGSQDEGEVELPDAYIRSAVHNGWKEDDARKFFEDNPEGAMTVFENLHQTTNNLTRQFAQLGRKAAEVAQAPAPKVDAKDDFDVEKFAEENDVSVGVAKQFRDLHRELAEAKTKPESIPEQRPYDVNLDNTAMKIDAFFSSGDMSPYGEFYGDIKPGEDWNDLKSGQKTNRRKVLILADQILGGAAIQEVPMTPEVALNQAHMVITEHLKDTIIRNQLRDTTTKRRKSFTMKPSEGKTGNTGDSTPKGKSKDRNELISRTEAKLAKVFG